MTDEADPLIERIQNGDGNALAEYAEQVRPQLTTFIERNLGASLKRKVEADDIFQETVADAVRGLPGMDLSEREPFSWLCQIAERRIVDAHRRYFGAQNPQVLTKDDMNNPTGDVALDETVASETIV